MTSVFDEAASELTASLAEARGYDRQVDQPRGPWDEVAAQTVHDLDLARQHEISRETAAMLDALVPEDGRDPITGVRPIEDVTANGDPAEAELDWSDPGLIALAHQELGDPADDGSAEWSDPLTPEDAAELLTDYADFFDANERAELAAQLTAAHDAHRAIAAGTATGHDMYVHLSDPANAAEFIRQMEEKGFSTAEFERIARTAGMEAAIDALGEMGPEGNDLDSQLNAVLVADRYTRAAA